MRTCPFCMFDPNPSKRLQKYTAKGFAKHAYEKHFDKLNAFEKRLYKNFK